MHIELPDIAIQFEDVGAGMRNLDDLRISPPSRFACSISGVPIVCRISASRQPAYTLPAFAPVIGIMNKTIDDRTRTSRP